LRNLISCDQFTKTELEALYELTDDIVKNPSAYADTLKGKIVATLFFEPSTRTRLSFESAVHRLGGAVIGTENGNAYSSAAKGESLEDAIRVVEGYCDAIIIRHSADDSAERAAAVSGIPIINGGAGKGEHPTQALLDIYTIRQARGAIDGLKIAVLGDLKHSRTIQSLLKLLALYENITIYGLTSKEFALQGKYIACNDFDDIPADVDVLYHTRTQTERHTERHERERYVIDNEVLSRFSDKTMLLHPLPRNEEISRDVDGDPRALYFKQTHNGVPVRMALLRLLVK
jgi:aspartate carbamoyltransferase catalytic subunit